MGAKESAAAESSEAGELARWSLIDDLHGSCERTTFLGVEGDLSAGVRCIL